MACGELRKGPGFHTGAWGAGGTQTEEETDTRTRESVAPPWNVICHDDPITPMPYVTKAFQDIFGYSLARAERLMLEVHNDGRSVVWTGGRERAELFVQKLQARHLRASMEQSDA